jgi:hypothetical protein
LHVWRAAALVIGVYAAAAVAAVIAPEHALRVAAKEGLLEALSHAVLLVGIVAWAVRARIAPRAVPILAAVVLAVVLAEELDWGGLFGVTLVAEVTGLENFHNSWGGASYLLFAVPFAVFFALPFTRLARHGPDRGHTFAFAVVMIVAAASALADPVWERALDELNETLAYGLAATSSNATRHRAPRAPSPVR